MCLYIKIYFIEEFMSPRFKQQILVSFAVAMYYSSSGMQEGADVALASGTHLAIVWELDIT